MKKQAILFLAMTTLLVFSGSVWGENSKGKMTKTKTLLRLSEAVGSTGVQAVYPARVSQSPGVSVGDGTSIWYDFQRNGGDPRRLWVLPDGTVHAIYMGDTDMVAPNGNGRGTFYAYSNDNGETFRNLGRVENQRSGFPSMDIRSDGRAVIASHTNDPSTTDPVNDPLLAAISVDLAPGFGVFSFGLSPQLPVEQIWPRVTLPVDERAVYWASASNHGDGSTWNSFDTNALAFRFDENAVAFPGIIDESIGAIANSANGQVAMLMLNRLADSTSTILNDFGENNIVMYHSSDGGLTFPDFVQITNNGNDVADSLHINWTGISALYLGEDLHVVWTDIKVLFTPYPQFTFNLEDLTVMHWAATVNDGVPTVALGWELERFGFDPNQDEGRNHLPLGYPVLGADEDGILSVAFVAFPTDTLSPNVDPISGFARGDIFAVSSADSGKTWGPPANLTNSDDVDDRYPDISRWNESGKINILYMSDPVAGTFVNFGGSGNDGAPISQPDFLFLKVDHPSTVPIVDSVDEPSQPKPTIFTLGKNYPNPFNPSTRIDFSIAVDAQVRFEIYNMLGQKVATLLNEHRRAGLHSVTWDAADVPSGIYFYRLNANSFTETKRMLLLK